MTFADWLFGCLGKHFLLALFGRKDHYALHFAFAQCESFKLPVLLHKAVDHPPIRGVHRFECHGFSLVFGALDLGEVFFQKSGFFAVAVAIGIQLNPVNALFVFKDAIGKKLQGLQHAAVLADQKT